MHRRNEFSQERHEPRDARRRTILQRFLHILALEFEHDLSFIIHIDRVALLILLPLEALDVRGISGVDPERRLEMERDALEREGGRVGFPGEEGDDARLFEREETADAVGDDELCLL